MAKGTSKGKGVGAGAHASGGNKGAGSGGRKAPKLKTVSPATTETAVSASMKGPMRPGGSFSSTDRRGGY